MLVTRDKLEAHLSPTPDMGFPDQVSGLSRRIGVIEKHFSDPNGTFGKMDARITNLEDRRAGDAIEQGGKSFRDLNAVAPWLRPSKTRTFIVIVWMWLHL